MSKKVLFVIDSLVCGGAEKSLVSLLSLLSRDKYELSIWMRNPVGEFIRLLPDDVEIVESPRYNLCESIKLKLATLFYSVMWRYNKVVGKREHHAEILYKCIGWAMKVPDGNWDVVIAYQQGVPTYLVADKFSGCKKLAWINVNIVNAGYNLSFNRQYYDKIDCIVPVSVALQSILQNALPQYSDRYVVVYDILNPETIRKMASENASRIKNGSEEYVIVTVGRLAVQKNYIDAVEAAAELKEMGLKFKWYFVGEGSERGNIEKRIKELGVSKNVILLGSQTNPYAFMQQADVYVQTSTFEGFGLTIAEAKILGKPIVSTNFDVVHDQLVHEKNGLIADMTAKSIAENIYIMISDDGLRSRIVEEVKKESNTTYITEIKKVESLID
jgi:glycosyltransferase involved in cell wall biosynthesis